MKKNIRKIIILSLLLCALCGMNTYAETAETPESSLRDNPNVVWTDPNGNKFNAAWTIKPYGGTWKNGKYTKAKKADAYAAKPGDCVSTGITSTRPELQAGQHYYKCKRADGLIPVSQWRVESKEVDGSASEHTCIHAGITDKTMESWYGVTLKTSVSNKEKEDDTIAKIGGGCRANYLYTGWLATCADCGEEIPIYVYTSEASISTIRYIEEGSNYYSLCSECRHIEQAVSFTHNCNSGVSYNKYTVNYDNNGGKNEMKNSVFMYNNETKHNGKYINAETNLRKNTFTRRGYNFKGWSLNKNAAPNEVMFMDEEEIFNYIGQDNHNSLLKDGTEEADDLQFTLYAVWEPVESTLNIDPNGYKYNGTTEITSITGKYEETYTIDMNRFETKDAYTVSFDSCGGDAVSPISGKMELDEWKPSTVFYGFFDNTTKIYKYGSTEGITDTLTAICSPRSIILPKPYRRHYVFRGWYEDASYNKFAGNNGDSYRPADDKNITLYAKWEWLEESTLNINPNGGSLWNSEDQSYHTETVARTDFYGSEIYIPGRSSDITSSGFRLIPPNGYTVTYDSNGGTKVSPDSAPYHLNEWQKSDNFHGELESYSYSDDESYTTSYKYTYNGHENDTDTITAVYAIAGVTLPTIERTNFIFSGWYKDAELTELVGNAGDYYEPDENVTLYAKWEQASKTGLLEVDPNGGTIDGETRIQVYAGKSGSYIMLSKPIPRENYTVSFETNGGEEIAPITEDITFSSYQKSATFYGTYKASTLRYTFNSASIGKVSRLTAQYNGIGVVLPKPTKSNHSFVGWYKDSDCTQFVGKEGDTYIPESNTTLYAKWATLILTTVNNYTAYEGMGAVDLSWTLPDGKAKNYGIFQKKEGASWEDITPTHWASGSIGEIGDIGGEEESSDEGSDTHIARDCAAPNKINSKQVGLYPVTSTESSGTSITSVQVVWAAPQDNGTTYFHQVKAYYNVSDEEESSGPIGGFSDAECIVSNITENLLTSGVAKYYYEINEDSEYKITSDNENEYTEETSLVIDIPETVKYLHIAAEDKAKNLSGTIHIKIDRNELSLNWPVYTNQILIEGNNIYPTDTLNKYFVKGSQDAYFFLNYNGYMNNSANENYQIDTAKYDITSDGKKELLNMTIPTVVPGEENIRYGSSDLTKSLTGENILLDGAYTEVTRINYAKTVSVFQRYTANPDYNGKTVEVIPRVSATNKLTGEIEESDPDEDKTHSISLIIDSKGPVIDGIDILEGLDIIDRSDETNKIILDLSASDELSGLKDMTVLIYNLDNGKERTYETTTGELNIDITQEDLLFNGEFSIQILATDNVGNETSYEYNLQEYTMRTDLKRKNDIKEHEKDNSYVIPDTPTFKAGEAGILEIRTTGYVDKIVATFEVPMIFTDVNPDYETKTFSQEYFYNEESYENNLELRTNGVMKQSINLIVPVNTKNGFYKVTINAFKDGQMLPITSVQEFYVSGNILENIRTVVVRKR